jgi:cytochrome c oxidase subunit II
LAVLVEQVDPMKHRINALILSAALALGGGQALAAPVAPAAAPVVELAAPVAAATNSAEATLPAAPEKLKPVPGIGQPVAGEMAFQKQFTPTGRYAVWFHNDILMPLITVISLFVLGLMLWAMVRFRRARNPTPSQTSHNTLIEVIWTLGPVLILIGVAIPSIDLLAKQFKPAPKDAVTVKVTGYQWYWGYEYPDHGVAEYTSNMLPDEKAIANGEPAKLAVDNRLVLPVGVPIKLIITGSDVIHAFSVPAFWVKMDAVPGRLNEKSFTIEKPGVYYGQCSELCGARHGFMPIAVEALPKEQFEQWVRSQGGKLPGEAEAAPASAEAAAPPVTTAATPAAAPQS